MSDSKKHAQCGAGQDNSSPEVKKKSIQGIKPGGSISKEDETFLDKELFDLIEEGKIGAAILKMITVILFYTVAIGLLYAIIQWVWRLFR